VNPQGVLSHLFQKGHRFEFFQAVWLLETLFGDATPGPGEAGKGQQEPIQIRPHTDLAFPATDVRQVAWTEEARAQMSVTFMGLYGIDAPLPTNFFDTITMEAEEGRVLRDFLDIFNHRLYSYFYRSWKKYRPGLYFDKKQHNVHAQAFLSLAGLSTPGTLASTSLPGLRLATFAGRLGTSVRNAEGLQVLLAAFLDGVPVRIEENVPRWVTVTMRAGLGATAKTPGSLGINTTLGRRLFDVSGKFRMVLGPLSLQQYEAFLPEGAKAQILQTLVRLYAPDHLDYDVELLVASTERMAVTLGDRRMQLGRSMWVGRPAHAVISEVVAYA